MPDVVVNTDALNVYANRLTNVNYRITRLDRRLDSLYWSVGLKDLYSVMQANVLVGYSYRLTRCSSYLLKTARIYNSTEATLKKLDPSNFKKPSIISGVIRNVYEDSVIGSLVVKQLDEVNDFVGDVGTAVKKGTKKVVKAIKGFIDDTIDSYNNKGWAYDVVQYGKATLKAGKGIVKIATGVAGLVGTAGTSTPVSIVSIISGCGDLFDAFSDVKNTYNDEYDKIGEKHFKNLLVDGGGTIGRFLGSEKIGEFVGGAAYYGMDLVSSLAALDCSLDKVKQLSSTDIGKLGSELKEIASLDVSKIFTTDVEALRYELKLASYTFKETTNFVSNMGAILTVADKAIDVGSNVDSIVMQNVEDWENPFLEIYGNVKDVKDKVGKGLNISKKITKFIFK